MYAPLASLRLRGLAALLLSQSHNRGLSLIAGNGLLRDQAIARLHGTAPLIQHFAHLVRKAAGRNGLLQDLSATDQSAMMLERILRERREEEHLDAGTHLRDTLSEFDTSDSRHDDIGKQQTHIRAIFVQQVQSLSSVRGFQYIVSKMNQKLRG